jgi:hypothetical protein
LADAIKPLHGCARNLLLQSSWHWREAAHQVFSSIEAKAMCQSTLSAASVSGQTFCPARSGVAVHARGNPGKNCRGSTAEKARLHKRAEVLREWLLPKLKAPLST